MGLNHKTERYNKIIIFSSLILFTMFILSCAPGAKEFVGEPNKASFFAGLWHGLICFFTFIISIFNKSVHIYESNNVGVLYDLGFILGVSIAFGSGGHTVSKNVRSNKK